MKNIFKILIYPFYHFFCFYLTNYLFAYIPIRFVRKLWLRLLGIKCSFYSYIDLGSYILCPWKLEIGENTHINRKVFLDARGGINIGNCVSISHNVSLISASHDINSKTFDFCCSPIVIEDYVFIGANVTVLKGCTIGKGAVLCTGAVVTKNVEPYTIVAGVPAKEIGKRKKELDYKCNPKSFFF